MWPKHIGIDDDCSEEEIIDAMQSEWRNLENLPNLRYLGGQIERADTGRLHIQFYVEFSKSYRMKEVLRSLSANIEPRKGTRDEARKYCRSTIYKGKVKGRIVLLPEFGEWRVEKASAVSPKQRALQMLKQGFSPSDILQHDPDVYFTHFRAIEATYGLLTKAGIILSTSGEEE
jgi:hypothetical protein